MSISIWQILLVVLLVVLLFGRGKISDLMGDVAKGIKSFRSGLKEDDTPEAKEPPKHVGHEKTQTPQGQTGATAGAETGTTAPERETEKVSR